LQQPSRIFVVGASAGGVEALKTLVSRLRGDFSGALLLVLHIPPQVPSLLAGILDRRGPLPVTDASDGATIQAGHIYVGVPDRHLLVDGTTLRLSRGPKENRFRPSIDALFRSAAYTLGPRVVGVVLTGQLDDGTSGLWAVKDRGGIAVVQSPQSAQFPSMPTSALQHVAVDHVVDLETLPDLLMQLASQPMPHASLAEPAAMRTENEIAVGADPLRAGSLELGKSTRITCPECQGVLSEVREGTIVRFRCHTGHAYSMQALIGDIENSIDSSLWGVLRALQERSILLREAAQLARQRNDPSGAALLESRARECDEKILPIRNLLQDPPASGHDTSQAHKPSL
jgi:two-component system, chemotaxis family, protein-glutamate methylesterase/glutaminase